MSDIDDGGPAFPMTYPGSPGAMSLRDYFAAHAPAPTENEINTQYGIDKSRNPYGENNKPRQRDRYEIVAYLAFRYADAMIAARTKDGER